MTERKTVFKLFWVWNFESEELWLNDMAASGWVLAAVGWCRYTFERCAPEEYTVRMEMRPFDEAYIIFQRDTGVQYIGRVFQWIYFRKPAELGAFDIYSDIDSKIAQLDRIGKQLAVIGFANLMIGIGNSIGAIHLGWINLLCATLLMYALGRIHGKREALKKERLLHD